MSVLKIKNTSSSAWKGIPTIKGAKGDKGDTGGNVTDAVKLALLQIAQDVWYLDDKGPEYIQNLQDALFPPADIVSVSAVYNQTSAVYDTTDIDDLKADLVVTANKVGGTTQTIAAADYTLHGDLAIGTSTITVIYRGFVTTFDVAVTREPTGLVDGTYYHGGSYGGVTVESNRITYANGQTTGYHYSIPLSKPIKLTAGDVVEFGGRNPSVTANTGISMGLNDVLRPSLVHPLTTAYSPETMTITSDFTATSVYSSAFEAMSGISFTLVIRVNGEEVIG